MWAIIGAFGSPSPEIYNFVIGLLMSFEKSSNTLE